MDERGSHTEARVELEAGRHVVYLDVYMVDANDRPTRVVPKRIAAYPTRRAADVAAEWMLRAARRDSSGPTGF
ncbi:MAG: hypothetical protein AAGB93_07935 [Planctomycetota bacterium]